MLGRERRLSSDEAMNRIKEALNVTRTCELRNPGVSQQRMLEGPQQKLRLCEWLDEQPKCRCFSCVTPYDCFVTGLLRVRLVSDTDEPPIIYGESHTCDSTR